MSITKKRHLTCATNSRPIWTTSSCRKEQETIIKKMGNDNYEEPSVRSEGTKKKKKGLFRIAKTLVGLKRRKSKNDSKRMVEFDEDDPTSTYVTNGHSGRNFSAMHTNSVNPVNGAHSSIDGAPIGHANDVAMMAFYETQEEEKVEKKRQKVKIAAKQISWILRTRYFRKICDKVFDAVDIDRSGLVDETELYFGLLMIHLKLGQYAGPAACKPLSRERCNAVFQQMDLDGSGALDKDEFAKVMMVLFGNVFIRVIVQWHLTIIFVPMIAKFAIFFVTYLYALAMKTLQDLDEYHQMRQAYDLTDDETIIGKIWERNVNVGIRVALGLIGKSCNYVFQFVPSSFWATLPVTILSTILGMIVVPYVIFRVDDFFMLLGDLRQGKTLRRKSSHGGSRRASMGKKGR